MRKIFITLSLVLSICGVAQVTFVTDTIFTGNTDVEDMSSFSGLTTSSPAGKAVPKLVFWIHGLAGNEKSWNRVNQATYDQGLYPVSGYPERIMDGCAISYADRENSPMSGLANYYIDQIEQWRKLYGRDTLNPLGNMAIAHSQGGIVARAMRKRYMDATLFPRKPAQFNALATFGTPHGGAPIINNSHPDTGMAQSWVTNGCRILTAVEINNLIDKYWLIATLINPKAVESFSNTLCYGFEDLVLPILISSIRKDAGTEYAAGSPYLPVIEDLARNTDSAMLVVTFYGVEQEPVLWRVLHSMTYDLDTVRGTHILATDPFAMNDDSGLPHEINKLISHYRAKARDYGSRSFDVFDRNRYYNRMKWQQNRNAVEWLETANMYWKRIIGARRDSTYANGYMCYCLSGTSYWTSDPRACSRYCTVVPYVRHMIIEEPSDGIVTVSSQRAYPGAPSFEMKNTNHMQERNCEETKNRLNELFDGLHGDAFRLYKR